ncbi:MAG: hypothetical protein PHO57_07410 [Acidithiobacillus sp.]|nr:hypothetical protein [Acidithiobacillus sp.]
MRARKLWKAAILAAAVALPGVAFADPLARMQADASAIAQIATTWSQLASAAQGYAQLAPYAAQEWAGRGPVVHTLFGGVEQCHNTRWDSVTSNLITGGLNIAGDAEAEAYAIQTVATDFQQQLSDYEVQQVRAGNTAVVDEIDQQNGPLQQSLNTLMSLLNTTGNQVAAALSPGSALHPLPISHWQAGIGNVPNLSAVQYIPGPNDGAPIGWFVPPSSSLARLVDKCPTGTGSIPMLQLDAPVMAGVNQMLADAPSMATAVQPIENGSSYTLPGGNGGVLTGIDPEYALRMNLVSALAANMQPLAGYMSPISTPLALYEKQVQTIMNEVQQ